MGDLAKDHTPPQRLFTEINITVPARRTQHVRFNDLHDPEPVPRGTDYASTITSNVPIVVQHTRLDSRRTNIALLSTIAYAG